MQLKTYQQRLDASGLTREQIEAMREASWWDPHTWGERIDGKDSW